MYQQVRVLYRPVAVTHGRPFGHLSVKSFDDKKAVHSQEWLDAKPTSEIPGPTKFELIRGFLPGGLFYKKSFVDLTKGCRKMYGDIFILPGMLGQKNILHVFNPDDFPILLRSEGVWPKRQGFDTMNYHRTVHRKDDFEGIIGLLGSNEEAWNKLRSAVNPILMQPKNARLYLNKILEVNSEFLQRIREIRDPDTLEMPDTFEDEINRLTFESVAVIALNHQLGLIRGDRTDEKINTLFKSLRTFFDLAYDLDFQPSLWRIVKTPKFRQMMAAQDSMYDITIEHINRAVKEIENDRSLRSENEEKSVLEKLLKIDKKVAVVMALDMLTAGVDTTTTVMVGALLAIGKSPQKQDKLRQELRTILPEKDSQLTLENMKNLPYLRACIKEAIRMYPVSTGSMRTTGEDVVLSGYRVPKHQDTILNSNLLLMEEKYFPNPKSFIPERWLRDAKIDHPPINPFLYIPFSFGARSCVGKRIVELEMEIMVAKLVRNFYIEFNYSVENAFKNALFNAPAIPLKFKFSEVEN